MGNKKEGDPWPGPSHGCKRSLPSIPPWGCLVKPGACCRRFRPGRRRVTILPHRAAVGWSASGLVSESVRVFDPGFHPVRGIHEVLLCGFVSGPGGGGDRRPGLGLGAGR